MQNFQALGLRPQTPKTVPPLRISCYTPGNFSLFIIICFFVAFVLSNFFLIVQLQPYDVNYRCTSMPIDGQVNAKR